MKVAFMLDEQISPRVAERLRAASLDARAVCGSPLAGQDDLSVFRAAVREGRILVTYNIADFSLVFADLLKEGVAIPGLVFVNPDSIRTSDIQGLARALGKLAERIASGAADPGGGIFLS